jgi:hypothetical protein
MLAEYFDGSVVYPTYLETLTGARTAKIWVWVVVGVFATALPLLGFLRWHNPAMLGTFTFLGASIAILPLAMKGIYAVLLSWTRLLPTFLRKDGATPSDYKRWAQQEFERLNNSVIPRNFGFAYALFALAAFWFGGAFDALPLLMLVLCGSITLLSSFVCGVGLAAVFFLGQSIWRLGREFPVRISEHGFGVLSVGRALVKSYALVAVVWCCYTASGTWALRGKWVPLLVLAAPAFVFFVSSFVICQFPLHLRMVDCKRAALLELDNLLEKLTPTDPNDLSQERQRQIEFCIALTKRVNHWPEWPFGIANLSRVLGVSVGAVAPQLIQFANIIIKYRHNGST